MGQANIGRRLCEVRKTVTGKTVGERQESTIGTVRLMISDFGTKYIYIYIYIIDPAGGGGGEVWGMDVQLQDWRKGVGVRVGYDRMGGEEGESRGMDSIERVKKGVGFDGCGVGGEGGWKVGRTRNHGLGKKRYLGTHIFPVASLVPSIGCAAVGLVRCPELVKEDTGYGVVDGEDPHAISSRVLGSGHFSEAGSGYGEFK